jgi:phage I-like protein
MEDLGTGSGWVLVFPRGKHYINKYETILDCNDKFFKTVELWWNNSTFKKPFLDKGHEFNESFGTFSEMRVTDKGLEMLLTLTEEGKELIKSGKYEYLSPTFGDAKDSEGKSFKNVIFTVSLVNYPALLVLDKIQNQIALSGGMGETIIKEGGSHMELRELIARMMKLSLAADDGSILAKIEELINSGATVEDLQAEILKMKAEVEAAKSALTTAEGEKAEAQEALSALKKSANEEEAKKVVEEAITFGQYHPGLKDMKVEAYLSNKDSVLKELSVIPKKSTDSQLSSSIVDGVTFSAEDKAILLDAGYNLEDPKDLALAKKFIESQGGK